MCSMPLRVAPVAWAPEGIRSVNTASNVGMDFLWNPGPGGDQRIVGLVGFGYNVGGIRDHRDIPVPGGRCRVVALADRVVAGVKAGGVPAVDVLPADIQVGVERLSGIA